LSLDLFCNLARCRYWIRAMHLFPIRSPDDIGNWEYKPSRLQIVNLVNLYRPYGIPPGQQGEIH